MKRFFLASSLFLAIIIAALHALAINFYFYWLYWWVDVVVHTLGGVLIGFIALTIYFYAGQDGKVDTGPKMFWFILIFVIVIGIGWEVFEYLTNVFVAEDPFPDTIHDLFADVAGAMTAYVLGYVICNRKCRGRIENKANETT